MKRRKHSSQFKSQIALEAIHGEETVSQIVSRYNIHPSQVQGWKSTALEGFPVCLRKDLGAMTLMNKTFPSSNEKLAN